VHPLRLFVLGLLLLLVGVYFWFAHRQQLEMHRAETDARSGRWEERGELRVWRGLVPMGAALIVASIVGGMGGSMVAVWGAGVLTLACAGFAYSPVLRRYPHLDLGQRATREELFSVRLSHRHGFVFWTTIVLLVLLGVAAVLVMLAA